MRILTLTMLGLFVAAAILSWRGVGASRFGIAISVVARSVLAWTVAIALAGGGVAGGLHLT